MESPFQLRQAYGADGIGFQEYDKDGNITRCTRYQSFTPWRNADLTNLDMLRDNQWAREEKSLGPRTAIRPSINDSSSYTIVYDADKVGVLCFYDKLYAAFFSQYIANSSGKFDYIDCYYEFLFVPREVSRIDYLQHLIGRVQCNPKPCIKQTFKEWPCIGPECHFSDPKEGDENSAEEVVWYVNRKGVEIKLKKKDMLNDEPLPKPCFNVCQDKVCPPPSVVCKDYIEQLAECEKRVENLNKEKTELLDQIVKLKGQLKGCQTQLAAANAEIADLKKPENKRNIVAFSACHYFQAILSQANWVMHTLGFEGYDEVYEKLRSLLSNGSQDLWKKDDATAFGVFQALYSYIAQTILASPNDPTKNIGMMYASFIKLMCVFTMFGTCQWQDITSNDVVALKSWYTRFQQSNYFIYIYNTMNVNVGEVKYITPEFIKDVPSLLSSEKYFSHSQAQGNDKKETDSGLGSTATTQEENQESPVSGVKDDGVRADSFQSQAHENTSPISSDKENDPLGMDEDDEDYSPTQGH